MMETDNIRNIPMMNAVEGFNPASFARELQNEDGTKSLYLDVKYRLLWFRLHNPEGKIDTEVVKVDDQSAVVCCRLYHDKADPADQYLAKATAQRFGSQEKFGDRYLEIAETAAIGRVLAAAGYGTQFCGTTDMFGDIIADAPVELASADDEAALSVSGNRVVHGVEAPEPIQKVSPMPTQPTPKQSTPKPEQNTAEVVAPKPTTLDDYLNTMSLDEAKAVKVDFGRYAGMTLGEVAMRNPGDLAWYAKNYAGRRMELKAGAMLLVRAATQMAS